MFNSCAFPLPHGMGGSERLSSGAWVGTSLPSPVLLGTRQPRRGEAAPAEPAAGLGQSRAGQGRGQLCALRGTSRWIERAALLQAGTVGPAASDLKRQAGLTVSGGEAPWSVASWQLILAKARKRPSACLAVLSWSAAFLWLQLPAPFPGRGQCLGRTHGPPNIMAGPPAQEHGAAPDTLPPSLATPTPVPTPGLCPGRCSARSVLPPPSHRSPPTCPRSGSRGDACPRDAQITAAACIPGTLPTAGRGRCAL